jgi:CheY-like chemotaxis protein
VMMPRMDGLAFLTHMRSDPLYARIPVVIITAMTLTSAERELLTAQTLGIMRKGEYLEEALHRVLARVEEQMPAEPATVGN